MLAAVVGLTVAGCEDDFRDRYGLMPKGEGTISLSMEFSPMAAALGKGRAAETADGKALNGIDDMCVLFYDEDGNLLTDCVFYYNSDPAKKPDELPAERFFTGKDRFKDVPRSDKDASNGQNAQEQSMQGKFDMVKIPYGNYYIIGVANLGNVESDNYSSATTTYDELFNASLRKHGNDPSTLDGLRGWRLDWDASKIANNAEMFGCFTLDQTSSEAARFFSEKELPKATVNRNGMELTAWLRRAASKVTIAFDGMKLRENTWIHLKEATIKDIPMGCDLGRVCKVMTEDSLLHESGQVIDYKNGKAADAVTDAGGKYNTEWTTITSGMKFPSKKNEDGSIVATGHTESELSLFFYENMQGFGRDKRQRPEIGPDGKPTGNVADNKVLKDDMPCGTYVEVTAFYRSRDNVVSNGDIIYRFMLGKDEITDFNAERNYHYRLTLQFNGRANDYDWHIDYNEEEGIKVPIPYYYVPYVYNQSMYYPVTIIGEITGELEAKITKSEWGPYDPATGKAPADFEYYKGTPINDGPWHGFVSLRQAPPATNGKGRKTIIGVNKDGTDAYVNKPGHWSGKPYTITVNGKDMPYNQAYWIGEGNSKLNEKLSNRGHRYYSLNEGLVSGKGDNTDDLADDGAYTVETIVKNGKKHTTFMIPLYSREMDLIKTSGYRGNNPYIGYYRYAEIEFTATVDGKREKTTAKILQVPRIVNPKGIYRSYNCTDPFNVHLMKLAHENDIAYTPVKSTGGPWSAEIEYMEGSGWLSVGGNTGIGQPIYGHTGDEIQFDVKFNSALKDPTAVRCAVIKVRYHNYSCIHRIMVRQGYAPVNITSSSTTKWHTCNLEYVEGNATTGYIAHEEKFPRGEGSMFKCGNLAQAILSENNKADQAGKARGSYTLKPTATSNWSGISQDLTKKFANIELSLETKEGKKCRLPKVDDFNALRSDCDFGAGILYGDGATKTQDSTIISRGYGSYLPAEERQKYGMRGWFVYNSSEGYDGRNLFFPIGAAGYGRRKHSQSDGNYGLMRYAGRNGVLDDAYQPLLYTLYSQNGAIYWINDTDASKNAWDINYSTFDFNIFDAATYQGNSDACFIRLVED